MSAGLPGLGLGGLFFIVSALFAPLVELVRTLRGRSRPGAWRAVGRQFAMALTMIVSIDLALRALLWAVAAAGIGGSGGESEVTVLPVAPIAITLGLLATLLAAVKVLQLGLRAHAMLPDERPAILGAPLPSRLRLGAAGTVLAVAWGTLLAFGASELSPLAGDGRGSAEGSPATPGSPAPLVQASRDPLREQRGSLPPTPAGDEPVTASEGATQAPATAQQPASAADAGGADSVGGSDGGAPSSGVEGGGSGSPAPAPDSGTPTDPAPTPAPDEPAPEVQPGDGPAEGGGPPPWVQAPPQAGPPA